MIDRTKIKKMWVWNDDQDKVDRYIIDAFPDGSCLAVNVSHEKAFESGEAYSVRKWKHYAEVYEEEYRPFKAKEITEEFFDYLFQRKGGTDQISKCTTVSLLASGSVYITGFWRGLDNLYEDWEIKKPVYSVNSDGTITKTYTDWMPAGVKE